MKPLNSLLLGLLITLPLSSFAAETTIGQAVELDGMEIGAVYLQPVQMEGMPPSDMNSDVHLETDIHALAGNPNGFGLGEWIPYLTITYKLTKAGTAWQSEGTLMPMVANDGPHYGKNVKLDGLGQYHLSFHILPPSAMGFSRHIDKETGVGPWWQPIDVSWDFEYLGTGKKGGY